MTIKHRIKALENRQPPGPDLTRFRAWLLALARADQAGPVEGLSNRQLLKRLRHRPAKEGA